MPGGDELVDLLNRAEDFSERVKPLIIKLRDIAKEIEDVLSDAPEIRVSRKRKSVNRGDKRYSYDYFEIKIGGRWIYVPVAEKEVISVFERVSRLISNLSIILRAINKL